MKYTSFKVKYLKQAQTIVADSHKNNLTVDFSKSTYDVLRENVQEHQNTNEFLLSKNLFFS